MPVSKMQHCPMLPFTMHLLFPPVRHTVAYGLCSLGTRSLPMPPKVEEEERRGKGEKRKTKQKKKQDPAALLIQPFRVPVIREASIAAAATFAR